MAARKLILLLLVGGLAGAAFAGMTTGVMRPYFEHRVHPVQTDDATTYTARPLAQSWLDQGLSLLDSPAWPFGQGSGDDAAPAPHPEGEGYAPDGYDVRDSYEVDHWRRGEQHGYRDREGYYEAGSGDGYSADDRAGPPAEHAAPAPTQPRQSDAATDAAARAANAAQDVIAAENAN